MINILLKIINRNITTCNKPIYQSTNLANYRIYDFSVQNQFGQLNLRCHLNGRLPIFPAGLAGASTNTRCFHKILSSF